MILKDNDISFLYYLEKFNVFADALNQMSMGSVSNFDVGRNELVKDVQYLPGWVLDLKILQRRVSWFIITASRL